MKFGIIGIGRFGYHLAITLADNGIEVLAVDSNETIISSIKDRVTQVICMEITDEESLRTIGIEDMDVVVVATGENLAQSILITTLLKKRLNMPRVIARATSDIHKEILTLIGADQVIIPEQEMGIKLADQLSSRLPGLTKLTRDFGIILLEAPEKFNQKSLKELDLVNKYKVNCIAFKRADEFEITSSDYIITRGDILLFAGEEPALAKVAHLK